ncbi:hypothetical protein [Paenibacillus sp. GYB003]|uniref:hypothetical protein n=1 Tax=Paenibacillus sp. GYB003 TaxID=2994392 RepID=UPI002F96DACD
MHKYRYRFRLRRHAFVPALLAAGLLLAPACSALTGAQADPEALLAQTISGLSGTDDFQFEGTTGVSVGRYPMQAGASFRGSVTGHNKLTMSFDGGPEGGSAVIESMRAGQDARAQVVFNRKENGWTPTEPASEGSAALLLPWSPLYKLEQLNTMRKRVESGRDETGLTVLTITPDEAETTKTVKDQLARQTELLAADRQLADLRAKFGLTEREAGRMKAELEQSVEKARNRIAEAGESIRAGSVYRIWIDRTTRLPVRMQVETDMNYTADGQPKQEKNRIDYKFTSYDNRPVGR